MTMVDADPSKAAAIGAMAGQPMIAARADEMKFAYFDAPGRQNPRFSFTAIFRGGVQQDWYASDVVFREMEPYNDPRLRVFFQPGPGASGDRLVALNSVEPFSPAAALVNMNLLRPTCRGQLLAFRAAAARGRGDRAWVLDGWP
jgi:hypothetical protein